MVPSKNRDNLRIGRYECSFDWVGVDWTAVVSVSKQSNSLGVSFLAEDKGWRRGSEESQERSLIAH